MIKITKGEDYTKYLHLQYAETGEPLNLSDSSITVQCQMRDVPGGTLLATAICEKDSQGHGDIWVHFPSLITKDLPVGEAGYDVWLIDNGKKRPIYTTRCQIAEAYTEFGS